MIGLGLGLWLAALGGGGAAPPVTGQGTPIGLLLTLTQVPATSLTGTPIGLLLTLTREA